MCDKGTPTETRDKVNQLKAKQHMLFPKDKFGIKQQDFKGHHVQGLFSFDSTCRYPDDY